MYKVFEKDYLDIPLVDMPNKGGVIVCLDPQKRLGAKTWAVLTAVSDEGISPALAKGLFWDREEAEIFASVISLSKSERERIFKTI